MNFRKPLLVVCLLIATFSNTPRAQSQTLPSSANDESSNLETSSPLMWFGFEARDKRPTDPQRTENVHQSLPRPATLDDDYVVVGSQTDNIQKVLFGQTVALKLEINQDDLQETITSATTSREQAIKSLEQETANKTRLEKIILEGKAADGDMQSLHDSQKKRLDYFSQKTAAELLIRGVVLEENAQSSKFEDIKTFILKTKDCGDALIDTLAKDPTQDTQRKIDCINNIIELVQKMQQLMLGCHTPFYITAAKDHLETLLQQADQSYWLPNCLEEKRHSLFNAETDSSEEALHTTTQIIEDFQSLINQCKKSIDQTSSNMEVATTEVSPELEKEKARQESERDSLKKAQLFYKFIENELRIETECGSSIALTKSIQEKLLSIKSEMQNLGVCSVAEDASQATEDTGTPASKALRHLNEILGQREFRASDLRVAQKPFDFFKSLLNGSLALTHDHDNHIPIAEHGFLILKEPPNSSANNVYYVSDPKEQKKWSDTTAILRSVTGSRYGMFNVECFDRRFAQNRQHNLSIYIKDLKDFLKTTESHTPQGHFMASAESLDSPKAIARFQEQLSKADASAILKFNEAVLNFRPSDKISISTERNKPEETHNKDAAQGKETARKIVEKIFQTSLISENRIHFILERFDKQFSTDPHLTAGKFRTFLKTEEEIIKQYPAGSWSDYFSPEFLKGIKYGSGSGLASIALVILGHHAFIPIYIVYFGIGCSIGGGAVYAAPHIKTFFQKNCIAPATAQNNPYSLSNQS